MRTTLILKDDLVKKAREMTSIQELTVLIHQGLELLIQREAARRLIRLGGSEPQARVPVRRK